MRIPNTCGVFTRNKLKLMETDIGSRRPSHRTNPYSEDDPWIEDIRLTLRELHTKIEHESRDAQVKLSEQEKKLQSHQKRMVLFDELSSLKSGGGGESSLVSALAKEISGKIMERVEASLRTCLNKGEFDRFNQTMEFKNANNLRDIAEIDEKITDADDFLVHNYYNKQAVDGLMRSVQEVASMEFTTKASFIGYQQELMMNFGEIETNFKKADAKAREGQKL